MGEGGRPISAHVHWRSIIGGGGAANICTCTLEEYNWEGGAANICTCTLEEYNWEGGAANICTCTLEEYNWGGGGGQYLHMYIGGV